MSQSCFATAVLNPDMPVPVGLMGPEGRPAGKRFDVYRNNVMGSLIRALEAGFPAIRKLVGEAFFAAMAAEFIRAHPPRSRILMLYGAEFAAFLAGFPPLADLPYLPDVARLEQALRESYHSADATALTPEALGKLTETEMLFSHLRLAPSLRVLRSDWPILSIWRANTQDGPPPQMQAQELAVLRPAYDPSPVLLPKGGAAVLLALQSGETLASALAEAGENLDLAALLGVLISGQAITGIEQ